MKILLSAYACEPNKGSEQGVGWHWLITLASQNHEVWAITRANNRESIEAALQNHPHSHNIHMVYYDLPTWLSRWKKGGKGVHLYYLLWQVGIYFVAKDLIKSQAFDYIHHVTFVTIRQPSFLGCLNIPFILGPLAGGESIPWALRKSFPLKGWIWDAWRDVMNAFVKLDPLMWLTFATASHIYVTSSATKTFIPKKYHSKVSIRLAIAAAEQEDTDLRKNTNNAQGEFKIVYAGNFLYLKGLHLALRGFAKFHQVYPNSRFTLIGSGADEGWLRALGDTLNLGTSIHWQGKMKQDALLKEYPQHSVFLFPSLRDSGGMVILEAMANALPVIALDIGGPSVLLNEHCGIKIPVQAETEESIVEKIYEALYLLAHDRALCDRLAQGALLRVKEITWINQVEAIVECFQRSM